MKDHQQSNERWEFEPAPLKPKLRGPDRLAIASYIP